MVNRESLDSLHATPIAPALFDLFIRYTSEWPPHADRLPIVLGRS
jgi:hypothetical protein